ncbi:MAG: hypothetical protein HWQ42_11590, partial [Nostoc sp. JL23]|nr:hypothetical protein [Nostoc sp. JL23]
MVITQRGKLGRSGLEVSPISFGGNVFGWTIDENSSFEILDCFRDFQRINYSKKNKKYVF